MSARARQDNQPGYVLHTYAFRETSLVVEAFTRAHGRVAMVARGAKRPRSALRGSIMAFQPLELSWSGRGELRLLLRAEWQGGQQRLQGRALLCGFYLNELLLKLLPREDAHEQLFLDYQTALARLAAEPEPGAVLRRFEKALLRELGYALALEGASGVGIDPGKLYAYEPERGPVAVNGAAQAGLVLSGQTLLDIAHDEYSDPSTLQQAKALMRLLISHRLEQKPLNSRRIFEELRQL
ncbi:MAG TPA: DNA repair protein RecO [Burkholderiales bacterium]|nr:DNA repair protein RecO [Burkholderiales bacterium]